MNLLIKTLILIIAVCAIIYITTSIAGFFDVSMESYDNYLFFIVGLIVLYYLLPTKNYSIF
jgi:hypothetical protein